MSRSSIQHSTYSEAREAVLRRFPVQKIMMTHTGERMVIDTEGCVRAFIRKNGEGYVVRPISR